MWLENDDLSYKINLVFAIEVVTVFDSVKPRGFWKNTLLFPWFQDWQSEIAPAILLFRQIKESSSQILLHNLHE